MIDAYLAFLLVLFGMSPTYSVADIPPEYRTQIIEKLVNEIRLPSWRIERQLPPCTVEPYIHPQQITASAGIVRDVASGSTLWARNANSSFPIASITKLMTAVVVIELDIDFEEEVEITADDLVSLPGNTLIVKQGELVRRQDLLLASLVSSMNNATRILARSTGLTEQQFVDQMNVTAERFGMQSTRFVDMTGLEPGNVSSAADITRFIERAFEYSRIRDAALHESLEIEILPSGRKQVARSTNELLNSRTLIFRGAKTGYLDEAGYTFAGVVEHAGYELSFVLLGSETSSARFLDAERLIDWVIKTHQWIRPSTKP